MSTKKQKPWYISLREHTIDPMFRSSAPGSIGRIFSTASFLMCCSYWMSRSTDRFAHEAPSSLLQVFYWTTGYVFANTVVRTASGHISERMAAIVPAIPGLNQLAGQAVQQNQSSYGAQGSSSMVMQPTPQYAPTQNTSTSPAATPSAVPAPPATSKSSTTSAATAKASALSAKSGHPVQDSDCG